MLSVNEAEQIILAHCHDYGTERLPFLATRDRVLAESMVADRDFPPYDRITMDGIALRYADFEARQRRFRVALTQAAGDVPPEHLAPDDCLEVMTGAALSTAADTVVPYEHLRLADGFAEVLDHPVVAGQNVHRRARDRRAGDVLVPAGRVLRSPEISVAAAVGATHLTVKKLPRVAVVSSGDELVDVAQTPETYQVRRSNSYAIASALQRFGVEADLLHVPDNLEVTRREVSRCLELYDVLLLSGGVSMGKFDFVPQALDDSGVVRHFHKVRQRPGKPFWFGTFGERGVVFAFPGNPVSTFACLQRYFVPWLETSLGISNPPEYARLSREVVFEPPLQHFLQVKLHHDEQARLTATPASGNGSGDFANLLDTDAFLELPAERSVFAAGELLRVWRF